MSLAQIEQFSSRVKNDPAMFKKLVAGTQTPDEFIDKAVALGAETGFTFSREEADGWIKSQIQAKANGELSDLQLEGVAGGKATPGEALDGAINGAIDGLNTAANWVDNNITAPVMNWFSSW